MNSLALRVVLLATLLFGLNAWAVRHLGTGLREIAIVNTFMGFVALALGWIDKPDADNLQARARALLERVVEGPVLLALYLVAIVGTSFISSVTVIADGQGGNTTLHLTPEGSERCTDCPGKSLEGPSAAVRFVRLTSIFGQPFYLEASNYQRKALTLFPWTGTTISVASDLVREPTLLLRIPAALHSSLPNGKVIVDFGGSDEPIEVSTRAGRASVLIGSAAAIPPAWRSEWRSELRTLDLPDPLLERFYRAWLNPLSDQGASSLAPEQSLVVRFLTGAGKEVIHQNVVVSRAPLQDVPLRPKE